jgi:hypothetical protein
MRFTNTTGSTVPVNALNSLFDAGIGSITGSPVLETAIVERGGGIEDNVKGAGNTVSSFNVNNGETCVFKIKWSGGIFPLNGISNNSYKNIIRSAGCEISGNWDVPDYFMNYLFQGCVNYNQQSGDIFDTSNWYPSSIGVYFLRQTWYGCTSLTTASILDTSSWPVILIDDHFMESTWYDCTSLITPAVPNTTNWIVSNSSLNFFLQQTWYNCNSLVTAIVPNTINWHPGAIGNYFLSRTWYGCSTLTSAAVPNTTNWTITGSIGDYFMFQTWALCNILSTSVVPDTTNWVVTGGIGSNFMTETWTNCSIVNGISPNTINWTPTTISVSYMRRTWYYNTTLRTCFLPDATNWGITSITPAFLQGTWANSFSTTYASTSNVTCKGSIYTGSLTPLAENSAGLLDIRIANVKVDAALIPTYQSSSSWTYITNSKFISW